MRVFTQRARSIRACRKDRHADTRDSLSCAGLQFSSEHTLGFGQTWHQILALLLCTDKASPGGSHVEHEMRMSSFVTTVTQINGNNKYFFICKMRIALISGYLEG